MVEYTDECVGCPAEVGCTGSACRYMNVPRFLCDCCGAEKEACDRVRRQYSDDILYIYDGDMLCIDCLFARFSHGTDDEDCECAECGSRYYGSELVNLGGRRLCRYCLAKEFEKVG